MSDSFVTLWTVAREALLSMGFPRQEEWSRLPFPTLGDIPDPGMETASLVSSTLAGGFFTSSVTGRKCKGCVFHPWVRKIPWSRKWQHTSVLFPGKFHGQKSLAGYGPWGCKESDMTEHTLTCYIIYNLCYC